MEVGRRNDEVRRVCIEGRGVSRAYLRFNRARCAEIETAQDAVVTFGQTLLNVVTKTEIERQFTREAPVVLEEHTVIKRLDRVVDRVVDLAGIAARTGGRNAEQKRGEVAAKYISQGARRIGGRRGKRAVKEELSALVSVGTE